MNRVLKFGGTSLGRASRLREVCRIILDAQSKYGDIAVCVSAMSGETKARGTTSRLLRVWDAACRGDRVDREISELEAFHREIFEEIVEDRQVRSTGMEFIHRQMRLLTNCVEEVRAGRHEITMRDRVIATGEILSAGIVAGLIRGAGGTADMLSFDDIVQKHNVSGRTDREFFLSMEKALGAEIGRPDNGQVRVLTGFVGMIPGGILERIGRGYTDFTAAMCCAGAGAKALEIWKEVDGIFSADPRKIPEACVLRQISYYEAAELSFFGTEAIHSRTMEPCIRKEIPIWVKNVLNPSAAGTLVSGEKKVSTHGIGKAVTQKSDISVISIESNRMQDSPGFIYRIGEIFYRYGISIDLMATSEVSVSITVYNLDSDREKKIRKELSEIGNVSIMRDLVSISIIGHGMQHHIGVAGRIFSVMGRHGINIILISQGASELSISFVVDKKDGDRAVSALHTEVL